MSERSCCKFPYGAFLALTGFLAGVLAFILCCRRKPSVEPQAVKTALSPSILLPDVMPGGALPAPEDLTLIEGIGTKVAAVLNASGIRRYQELANTSPAEIKALLAAAGNRISNPSTWPEQARLAAAGKWDELTALQSTLVGGRRV